MWSTWASPGAEQTLPQCLHCQLSRIRIRFLVACQYFFPPYFFEKHGPATRLRGFLGRKKLNRSGIGSQPYFRIRCQYRSASSRMCGLLLDQSDK